MGHLTLITLSLGVFVIHRLEFAMVNLCAEFED